VKEHSGAAAFKPNLLNVNPMAVADREHAGVKGAERFRQALHCLCGTLFLLNDDLCQ
jgi:hypothetical protein